MDKNCLCRFAATLCLSAGLASQVQAQAFTENFDNITTLTGSGWFQQNNSAPVGTNPVWFQGNPPSSGGPFIAYNGADNAYIAANFNSTAGGSGTISNWLATPNRTFRNGDVLTFWTRKYDVGQDFPDRMEVRLSTNGASTNVGVNATTVGDFTTLLTSINPSLIVGGYPLQWQQQTITISGLPAPTSGRIAFRYFVTAAGPTGTNSDYIGLDNVVYTPYVCPSFTLTPGGALGGATAGSVYSNTLTQTGALGLPSYAVTAGALPPGLTLSSGGTISGTPTATGIFNFSVTVSDASGCSGSQAYSIATGHSPRATPVDAIATAGDASAVISWSNAMADPYGGITTGYTVTAVQDNTKTCTSPNTSQSSGTCTVANLTNGDDYTFTVVAHGDGANSQPATTNQVTPMATQTIVFAAPSSQQYNSQLTLQATASSGLPITYTVAGNCNLSADVVSFTDVGGCTITASQAGTSTVEAAAPVSHTVAITPAEQLLSFTTSAPSSASVGGASYTFEADGGASGNPVVFSIDASSADVCSLSGNNTVLPEAVGTCTINANQAGNTQYAAAVQVQLQFTIAQANSTVTISSTPNPALPNQPITFSVSIELNSVQTTSLSLKALALPTGTIDIYDGSTLIGSESLVGGIATISTAGLNAAGNYNLIASYSGDMNYPAGQSAVYVQSISPAALVAVPTLSQWALLVLALGLAMLSAASLRSTASRR